eukprot:289365-Alexandrium_andersonii.AAC.1
MEMTLSVSMSICAATASAVPNSRSDNFVKLTLDQNIAGSIIWASRFSLARRTTGGKTSRVTAGGICKNWTSSSICARNCLPLTV